jgi:cell division transport system permease protein
MSLNLLYSIREGFQGLRRARFAAVLTISTIGITLSLFGVFSIFTVNIQTIVNEFKGKMVLEVFIDNSLAAQQVQLLQEKISKEDGIEEVNFISMEEALKRFQTEFGQDPIDLLGENPLPQSFEVKLQSSQRTPVKASQITKKLEQFQGVDEVIYHGTLFSLVDRYSRIILFVDIALLCVVLLSAILLIANTLRLTILSQRKTIHIMVLVGATKGFIRRPYLIQGLIEGGIGGGFAALVVWMCVQLLSIRISHLLEVPLLLFLMPLILGGLLGITGSHIGLKRFLKV